MADAVRRAAKGDQRAWDTLVGAFGRMVWAVAIAHRLNAADAGEVSQTTWLRLVEHLDRIEHPERLGGWLATTARRESLRLIKLRAREFPTDDETRLDHATDGPTPETVALEHERAVHLRRAFAALPERCRVLLHLVVVVQPPYAEVAAALDMPIGSIGPTRARCLERLRRLLGGDDPTAVLGGA